MKTLFFLSAFMLSSLAVAASESLQCTATLFEDNTMRQETKTAEFYVDVHRPSVLTAEVMIFIGDDYMAYASYNIDRGGANLGNSVSITRISDQVSVDSTSDSVSMYDRLNKVEMNCKLVPNIN